MNQIPWTVGYHIRSASGVTLDFTADLAAARKLAEIEHAQIFEVTKTNGRSVRVS